MEHNPAADTDLNASRVRRIAEIVQEIADGDCPAVGYFTVVPVEQRLTRSWSIF